MRSNNSQPLKFDFDRHVERLLGVKMPRQRQEELLRRSGFTIMDDDMVKPPPWRHDIDCAAALVTVIMINGNLL